MKTQPAQPLEERGAIFDLLKNAKTIAVVGISAKPERDSHIVARYLQAEGYRIVGVNPSSTEVLEQPCYPSLAAIPEALRGALDLVLVFRRPEDVAPIVTEMARLGLRRLWLQLGVASREVLQLAAEHGITVVSEKCIRVVHGQMPRPRQG